TIGWSSTIGQDRIDQHEAIEAGRDGQMQQALSVRTEDDTRVTVGERTIAVYIYFRANPSEDVGRREAFLRSEVDERHGDVDVPRRRGIDRDVAEATPRAAVHRPGVGCIAARIVCDADAIDALHAFEFSGASALGRALLFARIEQK